MKKSLSVIILIVLMLGILLTGCKGQKEVTNIIVHGLKTEYELNEPLTFEGVTATIVYNDETTKEVDGSELEFGVDNFDTSVTGKRPLTVSYEGFTTSITINVKDKSAEVMNRELVSIAYLSGLPTTVYVGDNINYNVIKILATYSDGTTEVLDLATNKNIKHNGDQINASVAGTYTLSMTFMDKVAEVSITVNEILLTSIEVDADTVDTVVVEGTAFDPTGMKVYANYNNGSKIAVALDDLTITQDATTVTISYNGKSVTLTLTSEPPTITSMTITSTGYAGQTIVVGDKISTAMVTATASFNNGTSKNIKIDDLKFEVPEITRAGKYTINVTYTLDESIKASYEINVLGIASMAINATTNLTKHPVNTAYDTSRLTVLITCTDGSTVERTVADGVAVDTSAVRIDTINPVENNTPVPYYITASYGGSVSTPLGVVVYDPENNYIIIDVDIPSSLSSLDSKKELFLNNSHSYVVGDDNPFIFKLDLTVVNEHGALQEGFSTYTSYFEITLDGAPADAKYYVIDGKNNSVDFTDDAVGKTFTIYTRPAIGVEGREDSMTRSLTVTVVDAYNIYEAWQLNYLTNHDTEYFHDDLIGTTKTQKQIVDEYLSGSGKAARPAHELSGIVIHNDIIIQREDIPAEYFVGGNRNNDLYDYMSVYNHLNRSASGTFNFYGNYYTIFSYNVPNVCAKGTYNNGDGISQASLFRFAVPFTSAGDSDPWRHMYENYNTVISDVYLRDNHPTSDNIYTADRDMRGLFGIKVIYQNVDIKNTRIEAYYISLGLDGDFTVVNLDESKFYNAWQNHIYIWSTNVTPCSNDAEPANVYTAATLNAVNSEITKCGGPVIICQTKLAEYNCGKKSGAQVHLDDSTEIWTYVTGQEAWFRAMNVTGIVTQFQGLGQLYKVQVGPNSFITTYDENGNTASGTTYMNMIMVNLASGTDITQALSGTTDIEGKFAIGDKVYLNMNDEYTSPNVLGGTVGYGDQNVANAIGGYGGQAPVLNTYMGGIAVYDGTSWQYALAPDPTTNAMNQYALGQGDYIALYMNNMGIVLGYNYAE